MGVNTMSVLLESKYESTQPGDENIRYDILICSGGDDQAITLCRGSIIFRVSFILIYKSYKTYDFVLG
jgi:hypothetical protein